MSINKENVKLIKSIRESSKCELKEIVEIIEKFEKLNYTPNREEIMNVLKFKYLTKSVNKSIKSIEDYINEIIYYKTNI